MLNLTHKTAGSPELDPRLRTYQSFLEFVNLDLTRERAISNRKMINVILWCFVIPTGVSLLALILIRVDVLARSAVMIYEWSMVVFPVSYLFFSLARDLLSESSVALKSGGVWQTLGRFLNEAEWRIKTSRDLRAKISTDPRMWEWISAQYHLDIDRMKLRSKHLTVLAGAVFFIIINGLDWIAADGDLLTSGFFQPDWTQLIGLGVFLALLSLSSSQVVFALERYRAAAQILECEPSDETAGNP